MAAKGSNDGADNQWAGLRARPAEDRRLLVVGRKHRQKRGDDRKRPMATAGVFMCVFGPHFRCRAFIAF
jgi:hypothetical protein